MGTFASVPQLSSSEQTDHSRQTDVSLATFPVSHGHEVCVFHHRPFVTDLCKCGNHSVVLSFLKCTECVIVFHLPFNFFFFFTDISRSRIRGNGSLCLIAQLHHLHSLILL